MTKLAVIIQNASIAQITTSHYRKSRATHVIGEKGRVAMNDAELAEKLQDHKGRIGSLEHRMDNVEKLTESVNTLAITTSKLVVEVKHNNENVQRISNKMDKQTEMPGKRLSQIKTAIITALATAIIAAIVGAIFMGI